MTFFINDDNPEDMIEDDPEFMGGSWYCGKCGTEFSPDPRYPKECPCPNCGAVLKRSGGYRT